MSWSALLAALLLALALVTGLSDTWRHAPPPHRALWVSAGDVLVRSVCLGHGDTTLVLLHGYGESLLAWRAVADPLSRDYRVVALDLPGFGVSGKPYSGYDLQSMTDRLADFVAHQASGPVVLVGHSMGGELAASLAIQHPDLVSGLILISPAGHGLSATASAVSGPTRALLGAATPLLLNIHDPAWLAEPPAQLRYDPITDPASRAAIARIARDFDFAGIGERFEAIRQPTLLIWGRLDPTIPLERGRVIHRLIRTSCLEVLGRGLHRPHEAEPDTVLALMRQFLAGGGCPPASSSSSIRSGD